MHPAAIKCLLAACPPSCHSISRPPACLHALPCLLPAAGCLPRQTEPLTAICLCWPLVSCLPDHSLQVQEKLKETKGEPFTMQTMAMIRNMIEGW